MHSVEYAKSGKSTCKQCKSTPALCASVWNRDLGDRSQTAWHHPTCLPASNALRTVALRKIPGFKGLMRKDQGVVRKLVGVGGGAGRDEYATRQKVDIQQRQKTRVFLERLHLAQHSEFKSLLSTLASLSNEELKQLCRKTSKRPPAPRPSLSPGAQTGKC